MEQWRFCRPAVVDLHHFDEEQDQDPNPHYTQKSDPDPHKCEKRAPDPQPCGRQECFQIIYASSRTVS
jgi:hypothetical protein